MIAMLGTLLCGSVIGGISGCVLESAYVAHKYNKIPVYSYMLIRVFQVTAL